jgi:hypothetical protein
MMPMHRTAPLPCAARWAATWMRALLLAAAQLGMRVELTVYSGGAGADAGGDAAVGAADGAAGASQQRRVV